MDVLFKRFPFDSGHWEARIKVIAYQRYRQSGQPLAVSKPSGRSSLKRAGLVLILADNLDREKNCVRSARFHIAVPLLVPLPPLLSPATRG
jgi:hypothetical protein